MGSEPGQEETKTTNEAQKEEESGTGRRIEMESKDKSIGKSSAVRVVGGGRGPNTVRIEGGERLASGSECWGGPLLSLKTLKTQDEENHSKEIAANASRVGKACDKRRYGRGRKPD